jgi:hypothetical protein
LRGRVLFINQELQHLSWQRVLDTEPLIVSVTQLVHEVHWSMHLFVEELRGTRSDWLERFELHEQYVRTLLPELGETGETVPHLAPERSNQTPS